MNDQNNVSDKVFNYIMEKIKSKEWLPNTKIMSENELCQELNVSRVVVRQALEKLVTLGLIKKKKGAGAFVANIESATYMNSLMPMLLLEDKDILHVLEFRKYFEYGNVRMFMKNHTAEDIAELEHYYKEMRENEDNIKAFYLADFNFHNVIAKGTKNPIVIKINELLIELLQSHQAVLYQKIGPNIGLEYHQYILRSIKDGDGEIAAMYMGRHIEAAIENYHKHQGKESGTDQ